MSRKVNSAGRSSIMSSSSKSISGSMSLSESKSGIGVGTLAGPLLSGGVC